MATSSAEAAVPRSRATHTRIYVGIALLIVAVVFAGFMPSFVDMARGAPRPWFLHVHAAIYLGWLALLVSQSVLAARGHIALHRRVGAFGVGYGALVWAVGVAVAIMAPALHVRTGEWDLDRAATFLVLPLGDMALFGGFLAAAVAYRSQPEIHKRLMLLACVAVMFAGAFRLSYVANLPMQILAWYSPVIVGMAYDKWVLGRVHRVYLVGAAIMAVALVRLPFGETDTWRRVGRALLAPLV